MEKQPLVSVVIPTFNRKDKLIRLIQSIQTSSYKNIEVIVVDDASTDGTSDTVRDLFPKIKIIRNSEELFLAGSRNVGIKNSNGDYFFAIDDDNIVDENTISELVSAIERKNNTPIGIVEPIMYYLKQPERVWCAGVKRNMTTSKTTLIGKDKIDRGQFNGLIESKDAPNAFMIKRNIINEVGLFNEKDFSIHYDEADFGERVRRAGNIIMCNPRAKVWHDISLPDKVKDKPRYFHVHNEFRAYYTAKNRIVFHNKYSKIWQFLIFIVLFNWILAIYYLEIILIRNQLAFKIKLKIAKSYLLGVFDGLIYIFKRNR